MISNLSELYDFTADYVEELRSTGHGALADELFRALRGGSTFGEVLDGIGVVYLKVQSAGLADQRVTEALAVIASVIGPPRGHQIANRGRAKSS